MEAQRLLSSGDEKALIAWAKGEMEPTPLEQPIYATVQKFKTSEASGGSGSGAGISGRPTPLPRNMKPLN